MIASRVRADEMIDQSAGSPMGNHQVPDWVRPDLDEREVAEADRAIRMARSHADALRRQAELLDPVTAEAFRRRASELELAAWSVRARLGDRRPIDRHLPLRGLGRAGRRSEQSVSVA